MVFTSEEREQFAGDGYVIARGLFDADETAGYLEHYMALRRQGEHWGDFAGVGATDGDPLTQWPRMIHMHRWDERSLDWLLEPRLDAAMTELLGASPLACQTMLYFKPPGSRGQALHQDQFYLKARPGTCIAAWMALDPCDTENGCLQVVPGSSELPVLCAVPADTEVSFTDVTVPLPPGYEPLPMVLAAGDVLFFNGSVIHGSLPNRTSDRFRRALIGHYVSADATAVARFYQPTLRMDGSPVEMETSEGGGPCGVWVDRDGVPAVELRG